MGAVDWLRPRKTSVVFYNVSFSLVFGWVVCTFIFCSSDNHFIESPSWMYDFIFHEQFISQQNTIYTNCWNCYRTLWQLQQVTLHNFARYRSEFLMYWSGLFIIVIKRVFCFDSPAPTASEDWYEFFMLVDGKEISRYCSGKCLFRVSSLLC